MAIQKDAAGRTEETIGAVRDFAQKGVDQAQQNAAQMRDVAASAASNLQDAATKSSKGFQELSLKTLEIARSNLNAHFDFMDALFKAKSLSQAVELQSAYAKKQVEALGAQTKELSSIAQKAVTDGSKPFQDLGAKTARSAQSAR